MILQGEPPSLHFFFPCVHTFVTMCQAKRQMLSLPQYLTSYCLLLMTELEKQAPNSLVKMLSSSNQ